MKRHLKAAFAAALALVMALATIPVSALPRVEGEIEACLEEAAYYDNTIGVNLTPAPEFTHPPTTQQPEDAKLEQTVVEPYWTVPSGYNAHDYNLLIAFLEQTDTNGKKNGEKLSETYDPNDPETFNECELHHSYSGSWHTVYVDSQAQFTWQIVNAEKRLHDIYIYQYLKVETTVMIGRCAANSCLLTVLRSLAFTINII